MKPTRLRILCNDLDTFRRIRDIALAQGFKACGLSGEYDAALLMDTTRLEDYVELGQAAGQGLPACMVGDVNCCVVHHFPALSSALSWLRSQRA